MQPTKQYARIPLTVLSLWLIFICPLLLIAGIVAAFWLGWLPVLIAIGVSLGGALLLLLFALQVATFEKLLESQRAKRLEQQTEEQGKGREW